MRLGSKPGWLRQAGCLAVVSWCVLFLSFVVLFVWFQSEVCGAVESLECGAAAEQPEQGGSDREADQGGSDQPADNADRHRMEDFLARFAGGEHERHQSDARSQRSHADWNKAFEGASLDHGAGEALALVADEMQIVGEHHNAVTGSHAAYRDEADKGGDGDVAGSAADEAIAINRKTFSYHLLEKRIKYNGKNYNYFSENLLAEKPDISVNKAIKTIKKTAESVAKSYDDNDFAFSQKVQNAVFHAVEKQDPSNKCTNSCKA